MANFYDAYNGGRQEHPTTLQVMQAVADLGYERHGVTPTGIVSDAVAQAIASWWHSPGNPLTTRLSTMGIVDMELDLDDFATEAERPQYDVPGRAALAALGAYIQRKQAEAPSGVRPCACDDCLDLVVGKRGALCQECEEAGCDNQSSACQRDDAYGAESDCPACGNPIDYCQGHGESGDPAGRRVLEMHDAGNHSRCITERGWCD